MNEHRYASKQDLARIISECARNSPHIVPLVTAAYDDVLSVAWVARGQAAPLRLLDRAKKPSIVLLGDDFADGFDPGPAGWPGLPRIMRWARLAVVNATSGVREHYETFVGLATESRKLLLIETGTARADAWLAACRAVEVPTIFLKPEDGGHHPATSSRGTLH